ncbi:zinc finger, CCHC-type containing protein [Tanacetum coccineum]
MMDGAILVAVIIDKLPPSWKEFKYSLKHKKEELNLVQLVSYLRIEEGLRNQELDNNPKGKNQIGSSFVNMVEGDRAKNSNNNKNKRKFKSDQVNKTKEFLSSNFDMKDLGEAEVILGIRIKRGNNGISISQSRYIEKILTKFNFANCSPVYTPVDPTMKFRPNKGTPVSQLEYSRAIGCLMYAMISTRPDIAFAVGKLSRGYPSVIEGYSDASWINNMEDHSSTSGWVFLLGGAGNEAEWLRNLVYEIPLWPKPVSTISIRCDSAATLAKA